MISNHFRSSCGHACRVRIADLVLSPVLAELLQLRPSSAHATVDHTGSLQQHAGGSPAAVPGNNQLAVADEAESAAGAAEQADSWFEPATASRLVGLYHSLDADGAGLTPADLIRCGRPCNRSLGI